LLFGALGVLSTTVADLLLIDITSNCPLLRTIHQAPRYLNIRDHSYSLSLVGAVPARLVSGGRNPWQWLLLRRIMRLRHEELVEEMSDRQQKKEISGVGYPLVPKPTVKTVAFRRFRID
jgi:hypothetical protein